MDEAILARHIDVMHTPIGKLNLREMENILKSDPWIAEAQVFVDNNNVLHLNIAQRTPIARLFLNDGSSVYMDSALCFMPLSATYIYYTTVVTNFPAVASDSVHDALKKQIRYIINTVQTDSFWNAQISQIIIDSANMFQFLPVLGDQTIILGDTSLLREKLDNLFAFYNRVLNRIGWDKYETLDLRFKNEVIARPSLPYKAPEDKAAAGMNWINTIIENEARNASHDTASNQYDDDKESGAAPQKPDSKDKVADKDKKEEKTKSASAGKGDNKQKEKNKKKEHSARKK